MSSQQRIVEQIQQRGIASVSDADLLSFVLCSKKTVKEREKALRYMKELLVEHGGLSGMLNTDAGGVFHQEFEPVLATRLQALFELTCRLMRPVESRYQIRSAEDVVDVVGSKMRYLDHEEIRVLVLNTRNDIVANLSLYRGTVNSSVLRVAEIFHPAVTRKCPKIVLCHNHPSGDPTPSPEDMLVTQQCVEAGKLLDIEFLDHVVIGNPRWVSLKERIRWS